MANDNKPEYVDPAASARELCLERFRADDPEGYAEFEKAQAEEKQKKAKSKAQAEEK